MVHWGRLGRLQNLKKTLAVAHTTLRYEIVAQGVRGNQPILPVFAPALPQTRRWILCASQGSVAVSDR